MAWGHFDLEWGYLKTFGKRNSTGDGAGRFQNVRMFGRGVSDCWLWAPALALWHHAHFNKGFVLEEGPPNGTLF